MESTEYEVKLDSGEIFFVKILTADKQKPGHGTTDTSYPRLRVSDTPFEEWYVKDAPRRCITVRSRKYSLNFEYLRVHGKWEQTYRPYDGGLYNEGGIPPHSSSGIHDTVDGIVMKAVNKFMDLVPDWEARSLILEQERIMEAVNKEKDRLKRFIKEQDARYTKAWHEVHDNLNKRLMR